MQFLTCDHCGGKSYVGGIYPRKQTRGELMEDIQHKGKCQAICQHCGRISVLRVIPLSQKGGANALVS